MAGLVSRSVPELLGSRWLGRGLGGAAGDAAPGGPRVLGGGRQVGRVTVVRLPGPAHQGPGRPLPWAGDLSRGLSWDGKRTGQTWPLGRARRGQGGSPRLGPPFCVRPGVQRQVRPTCVCLGCRHCPRPEPRPLAGRSPSQLGARALLAAPSDQGKGLTRGRCLWSLGIPGECFDACAEGCAWRSVALCPSGRVTCQSPADSSAACSPLASPADFGGGPAGWHPPPRPGRHASQAKVQGHPPLGPKPVCSSPEAGPPGALGRAWPGRLLATGSPAPLGRDGGRWYGRERRASSGPSGGPGLAAVAGGTPGACAGRTGVCGPWGVRACSVCGFSAALIRGAAGGGSRRGLWQSRARPAVRLGVRATQSLGLGRGAAPPHRCWAGEGLVLSLPSATWCHGAPRRGPALPRSHWADLSRPPGGFLRVGLGLQPGRPRSGILFSLVRGHFRAQQRGALWAP